MRTGAPWKDLPPRHSCRRWKVERRFARLQNNRRILTRDERHVENSLAFVQFACIVILSRRCLRWPLET
jgi:transposase